MGARRIAGIGMARLWVLGWLIGGSAASPALAGLFTVEARVGPTAPVTGDLRTEYELDLGVATGASVGLELAELFLLELRYDALAVFGGTPGDRPPSRYGPLEGPTDTHAFLHAVTLGPGLTRRWDRFEVTAGLFPGVYVTRLEAEGLVPGADPARSAERESGSLVDWGLRGTVGGPVARHGGALRQPRR